jgi:uncharacterized membrane-anchored protein YjiN (DUF445 family)
MTIPAPSRDRLVALRRMKATAAGLLVLAAAVYILCRTVGDGRGVWGYIQATAEASMVGGLADWFAVTALFRHPLGLPIPHTAIIPRKKDQIGEGLAGFVNDYFLTEDVISERIAGAQVPQRVGAWLAVPQHADEVADELGRAVRGMADVLHDDELRNTVAGFADRSIRELDVAPLLARVIDAVCDSGQHQQMLTAALRGTMRFLDENRGVFRQRLSHESPSWVPDWLDDRVFTRAFTGLQSFLADLTLDSHHELRGTFERQLRAFAERLRTDPEQAAKVEQAKLQLLEHPTVRDWLNSLWTRAKELVLAEAADPNSQLHKTVAQLTIRAGETLRDDAGAAAKLEEVLQRVAGHVVANYGTDLAAVISSTVQRWDTRETSRRLELQVGRDLQFIRINGTVVGALAGLLIYSLSRLL